VPLCYHYSEVLYALMFLRVLFLLRAGFNYTLYQDNHARHCCQLFGVRANLRFSVKCILKKYPLTLILLLVLPSFFVLGIILRVFERPFSHVSGKNFNVIWNSIWCIAITMATIGYGDISPATHFGRLVAILCSFWGAFTFSVLVVALERVINLQKQETRSYKIINSSRTAASVIQALLFYNFLRRRDS
jgi:hypothetical protein